MNLRFDPRALPNPFTCFSFVFGLLELNNRNSFSHTSGYWKPRSRCKEIQPLGKSFFLVNGCFLVSSSGFLSVADSVKERKIFLV